MTEQVVGPVGRRGRPPMSDRHREQTRLDISRIAVGLFQRHGLTGTGAEQIADAAGISVRTLWRYFRSKEACVEPLLRLCTDAWVTALRSWPRDRDLQEHLTQVMALGPDAEPEDDDRVRAVIRLATTEPELRAVWLVLCDRAEKVLGTVLAERYGMDEGTLEIRVQAAALNAAQRLALEELGSTDGSLDSLRPHRARLSKAVARVYRDFTVAPELPAP